VCTHDPGQVRERESHDPGQVPVPGRAKKGSEKRRSFFVVAGFQVREARVRGDLCYQVPGERLEYRDL